MSNDGVIYLKAGAELTIIGTGTLNIIPNKYMAINGTDSTFLTMESGNIQITSSSKVGGIYLRKGITFNGGTFSYNVESGIHHAIDTEGTITITKGTFNILSGNGKGLQAENNLFIGKEGNSDSDLIINIKTSDEGIEAKGIEIYSGTIMIEAGGDGINAANKSTNYDVTIEINGGEHFGDKKREQSDARKSEICKAKGWILLMIPNSFVKNYSQLCKIIMESKDIVDTQKSFNFDDLEDNEVKQEEKPAPQTIQKIKIRKQDGYCIRCGKDISYNPQIPYCKKCYYSWNRHGGYEYYSENYCHQCGTSSYGICFERPECKSCYYK